MLTVHLSHTRYTQAHYTLSISFSSITLFPIVLYTVTNSITFMLYHHTFSCFVCYIIAEPFLYSSFLNVFEELYPTVLRLQGSMKPDHIGAAIITTPT